MNPHFQDYYWKKGKPYGIGPIENRLVRSTEMSFKIIADPYYKHISLEKYQRGSFVETIYDSLILDFRSLKPEDQLGWQKELVREGTREIVNVIRNHHDRIILIEQQTFEKQFCRECVLYSPQGIHVSSHKMQYTILGDKLNTVTLFDANNKIVMYKKYQAASDGTFTNLLEEYWDFGPDNILKFLECNNLSPLS